MVADLVADLTMTLSLPIYKRGNTFVLHIRIAGRQIKRSLATNDPSLAKLRAMQLLGQITTDRLGQATDKQKLLALPGEHGSPSSKATDVPCELTVSNESLPEYVQSLPLGPLFPLLPVKGANGAGGQFGQWFGNFKRAKGFDSPTKTLHSFRHLVASELRLLSVAESLADAITGHTGESVARTVYAATIKRHAERLRPEINKLSYENLTLRRVWKAG